MGDTGLERCEGEMTSSSDRIVRWEWSDYGQVDRSDLYQNWGWVESMWKSNVNGLNARYVRFFFYENEKLENRLHKKFFSSFPPKM